MDWFALMLHSIAVNNVMIRGWLNGDLIPLNLCMMFIIGYTVWRQTKFSWGWTKYPGANSACALWWIFFADFLRSVMAWAILRATQIQGVTIVTYQTSPVATLIYIAAGVIATVATLRCIWCLTPVKGRNVTWIFALSFTLIMVGAIQMGWFDFVANWIVQRAIHS